MSGLVMIAYSVGHILRSIRPAHPAEKISPAP
jgi:hypothetical protein